MHRIDSSTRDQDLFGAGKDGFTEGTPGTEAATVVTDDWLNGVQEEIVSPIEDVDIALVKGTRDQLMTAMKKYMASICVGTWAKNSLAAFAGNVNDIAYGNGYFVAIGDSGDLEYSQDGINWAANDQGASNLEGVHYGNGYWVVVGASGTLYYATDPTGAWTSNTQGAVGFNDVYYDNGYWVAVGTSGNLYYKATNPIGAWTSNTQGSSNFYTVHYGNGYWVAAGASGILYYATDPTGSWTSNTQGSNLLKRLHYANGYWMASGQSGTFLYKATIPTGTWTANSPGSGAFYGLYSWYGCIIVASLAGEVLVNKTVDGTWVPVMYDASDAYNSACYGNGRVLLGTGNAEILTSLQFAFDV